MKRLLLCLVLLAGVCLAQGSGYNAYQAGSFTTTGSGVSMKQNTTILYHQLSWVKSGTVSSCTVAIDSSPDGVTWAPGGILTGQTCTSNGNSAFVNAQAVYIRVTFTALSGGGMVQYFYKGWAYNATGSGASPGGPAGGDLTGTYPNPSVAQVGYDKITAASNTTAKTEGTGGSLSPVNLGQVAGNQAWFSSPPVLLQTQGNFSMSLTGGTIGSGQVILSSYSLNSAAGETITGPQFAVNLSTAGCTGGSTCTITIAPPSIPTGYTSWNAYFCDTSGGCSVPQKVTACTALSGATSCTITTPNPATSGTQNYINTAILQPTNIQATDCPTGVTRPQMFEQHTNGNWYTTAGMDQTTQNSNTGLFTWCHQVVFSDFGWQASTFRQANSVVPSYSNSLAIFNHDHSLLSQANQNRMLAGISLTPVGFNGTLYGAELMQFEMDKNCDGCTINGSPDGEFTLGSWQMQDNSVTNTSTSYGTNVARFHYYKAGAGNDNGGMNAINGIMQFNNNTNSLVANVYRSQCRTASVYSFTVGCYGFNHSYQPNLTAGGFGQVAIYAAGAPGGGNNGLNMFLRNDSLSDLPSFMNGNVWLDGITSSNTSALPVKASVSISGSLTVTQPSTTGLAIQTVSCTGGASSYSYQLVGVDNNGGQTLAGAAAGCTTGVNPLTSGNPATITYAGNNSKNDTAGQFVRIDVYRVTGPMATGKIGSLTCALNTWTAARCSAFSDTGLSASGAVPTITTTGSIDAPLYKTSTNCAAAGTAANPSVVNCTAAPAGAVYCDVAASAGTCTVNTTAITATSRVFITPSAADATEIGGGITCNTALTFGTAPLLAAKVAGTSFTINMPTVTTNGACFEYFIVN